MRCRAGLHAAVVLPAAAADLWGGVAQGAAGAPLQPGHAAGVPQPLRPRRQLQRCAENVMWRYYGTCRSGRLAGWQARVCIA